MRSKRKIGPVLEMSSLGCPDLKGSDLSLVLTCSCCGPDLGVELSQELPHIPLLLALGSLKKKAGWGRAASSAIFIAKMKRSELLLINQFMN